MENLGINNISLESFDAKFKRETPLKIKEEDTSCVYFQRRFIRVKAKINLKNSSSQNSKLVLKNRWTFGIVEAYCRYEVQYRYQSGSTCYEIHPIKTKRLLALNRVPSSKMHPFMVQYEMEPGTIESQSLELGYSEENAKCKVEKICSDKPLENINFEEEIKGWIVAVNHGSQMKNDKIVAVEILSSYTLRQRFRIDFDDRFNSTIIQICPSSFYIDPLPILMPQILLDSRARAKLFMTIIWRPCADGKCPLLIKAPKALAVENWNIWISEMLVHKNSKLKEPDVSYVLLTEGDRLMGNIKCAPLSSSQAVYNNSPNNTC